jgi:LPXTG-motif cell wall-anchored protein
MTIRRTVLALVAGAFLGLTLLATPSAMAATYPPPGGDSSEDASVEGVSVSDPADVSGGGLARTGTDVLTLSAVAIGLIGAGTGMVVVLRRRRDAHAVA